MIKLPNLLAQYVSQINNVNSPSPSLLAIEPSGIPMPGGMALGKAFYLSESQAQNASGNVCHEGYYMPVKVDSGATAGGVAVGLVGQRLNAGDGTDASTWTYTDADHGIPLSPVVFLCTVTPGNYTIVQVSGVATTKASAAVAANALVSYGTTGEIVTEATDAIVAQHAGVALAAIAAAGDSGLIAFQPLAGACV